MNPNRAKQAKPANSQQQDQAGQTLAVNKPKHSGPEKHDQYIRDPLAHFLSIPWAAKALTDPAVLDIVVSDRTRLATGDKQFVRSILSSETTVRACVTYFLKVPSQQQQEEPRQQQGKKRLFPTSGHQEVGEGVQQPLSKSKALLQGGGPENGEGPEKPFLLFNALLDLGEDLCGFKGTLHGGALVVLLDETMCAAADNQSSYAFTATMTTKFLKPVKLPGVVVVRSRVIKKEGRKIWVRGSIEDGDGNLMAESEAMLVDKTPDKMVKSHL